LGAANESEDQALKTLSLTLALRIGLLLSLMMSVAVAAPRYPRILEVQGQVQWTNKDGKQATLKNHQTLIEKASLQTGDKSDVLVELDADRKLRLYAGSRLEIPSISWETGDAPIVILKYGRFRWQETKRNYNIALQSDLFQFLSPVGDFIFSYDAKNAVAEVMVVQGSMEFSAMNGEEVAPLKAGQKVKFQGVREGDEIVYDVLLQGKKIPRGKLGAVQSMTPTDKKTYSAEKEKKADDIRRKKAEAEKIAQAKPKDSLAICSRPAARLNQCAWICEHNPSKEKKKCLLEKPEVRCVRQRCNANGEWNDVTVMAADKGFLCAAEPTVKDCDY
jgi:hypothetical protein